MSILTMSLTGGVFIAVTLLLRAIFQHIVPRRTFLILWIAANLLLLIPLRLPLPTSIYTLASPEPAAMTVQTFAAQMTDAVPSAPTGGQAPMPLYTIIWLTGAVLLLGCALFVHGSNLRLFRFAIPVKEHPAELPGWVRVKRLDGLSTPLTYGILRPTILLPAGESATEEQLRHIYLHELCHIRNFDVLRKYILLLTLAIHWFNPLVWVMIYAAMQDMEMRCDAQVVHVLGAKKAYANTLVQMETGKMQRILETGFSFSSTNSRLKALLKAKRLGRFSILLALMLCISTVLVFATDAATPEQKAIAPDTQTIAAPPPTAEPQTPEPIITPTEPQKPEPIPEKPEEDPLPVPEEKVPEEPEPPEKPEQPAPEEPDTAPPQPDPAPQEPEPPVQTPDPEPVTPEPKPEPPTTASSSIDAVRESPADKMSQGGYDKLDLLIKGESVPTVYSDNPSVIGIENWGEYFGWSTSSTVHGYHWGINYLSVGSATVYCVLDGAVVWQKTLTVSQPPIEWFGNMPDVDDMPADMTTEGG